MASIKERKGKFCVIYNYKDASGKRRQKWETYGTKAEAKKRKKEIEYREELGKLVIPKCKTLKELMEEYVSLYGEDMWALSTYSGNISLMNNYILPIIGDKKLSEINTRFIEKYYQTLLHTPAVVNPAIGKPYNEYVSASTVRDVHKLLRSCFEQGVKWELLEKNPCTHANVPKHKAHKREIWTAETLMYALEVCDNEFLKLAINLAFAGSLRMGELLGLTWDCTDLSEEAIRENRAYIYINKEVQRASKEAITTLDGKDVILVFPSSHNTCRTVRVLKSPKTESSVRKVFLPQSVAMELLRWKKQQDEIKQVLGEEYSDYGLIMATPYGMPSGAAYIRGQFKKLIKDHNLPPVVFHSLRHTSVTYKLKLNGGDIKAVQGDSGHAQINMVTDVYSHIIDDDRRKNAELFENAFYKKKELTPQLHQSSEEGKTLSVPEGVDVDALMKVLANPEMTALLQSLAKTMK